MYDYEYFPRAAPRPPPKPGKAKKKFGETWWGKKWVDILSEYESDQRMSRGRAYARADKVKNFKIDEKRIKAVVEGSSGNYKVKINFKGYSNKDWQRIIQKLKETPLILGSLLNNELPENISECVGCSFVPEKFKSSCSCPDYANPCKHIAAVFYTLADEIDYNPMILFELMGMKKDKLLEKLELIESKTIIKTKKERKLKKEKTSLRKPAKKQAKKIKMRKTKSRKKK